MILILYVPLEMFYFLSSKHVMLIFILSQVKRNYYIEAICNIVLPIDKVWRVHVYVWWNLGNCKIKSWKMLYQGMKREMF